MLERAKWNICWDSSGDRFNSCWIQRKSPQEFPSNGWTGAVPWIKWPVAGQSCWWPLTRRFLPFSKLLCAWNVTFSLHGSSKPQMLQLETWVSCSQQDWDEPGCSIKIWDLSWDHWPLDGLCWETKPELGWAIRIKNWGLDLGSRAWESKPWGFDSSRTELNGIIAIAFPAQRVFWIILGFLLPIMLLACLIFLRLCFHKQLYFWAVCGICQALFDYFSNTAQAPWKSSTFNSFSAVEALLCMGNFDLQDVKGESTAL